MESVIVYKYTFDEDKVILRGFYNVVWYLLKEEIYVGLVHRY
jgi:hypothetical protein